MLTLYYKPSCPFCQRVLQTAENLGIEFELKDISESDDFSTELIERGGKRQVPYLVDAKNGVEMYESSDIIDHLREHKADFVAEASSAPKARMHISDAVCESCEG